ncbi:MAG TPA: PSD1 and planctomycete cytochrome C domain-containing protein [Isosphaeraceae bacterium]|nr:PSD1 and planctomycete cytochrome C domain-containing protein [Isosphaeraceae bacterium]
MKLTLFTLPIVLLTMPARLTADAGGPDPVDFVRDVRPILETHCHRCHGPAKQKSGLRLDARAGALKGGDAFGPSIVSGKAAESPLIQLVSGKNNDLRMPPTGDRLSAADIATLTRWIDGGASWPDGTEREGHANRLDHWSFRPPKDAVPPQIVEKAWPRGPIDRFILARLEKEGLRPAPEADRATWLRRVTLDLTGLPPSPERVASFVADPRPDAHERAADELLASPRYGERWAQHWLDVVRYADTHGFEVNTARPNAWPYRDYVIAAFNADIPYDRFIREQLAGDALGRDAATGFLVTASVLLPGQIGADEPSKRLARQDALDEIVTNTGLTLLGLGLGCARCHDHKFDPISQRDYYAMQAFFAGVEYGDRPLRSPQAEALREEAARLRRELEEIDRKLARLEPRARSGAERPPVNAKANHDRFAPVIADRLRFTIGATNSLEPCLDEVEVFDVEGQNVALAAEGTTATSSGDTVVTDRHELRHVNDGRYGNSRSWMSNRAGRGWVELDFPRGHTIDLVVWGRDREGKYDDRLAVDYRIEVATGSGDWRTVADSTDRRKYRRDQQPDLSFSTDGLEPAEAREAARLMKLRKTLAARLVATGMGQLVFAGTFRTPDVIRRLQRGDPEQPKEEVAPAVPRALGSVELTKDAPEDERRRALAEWIASPANPLTARVMVNRLWQGHFGVGLVETTNDFGLNGARSTHPELLDWLASEFVRSGWSSKHMHRLIVLSATYRQSSRIDPAARARDADARLLWRFPTRRLEAEAIRDAMLATSGRLDLRMGGPGFDLFRQRGGLSGFTPVESYGGDGLRRMIYAHRVRRERDVVFGAFDCPDGGQSTARRRESTTPIQALNLFNSRFTADEAAAFAARIRAEVGNDPTAQVHRAYRLALSRDPDGEEAEEVVPVVREHGLPALCRALFNCNEFLTLP